MVDANRCVGIVRYAAVGITSFVAGFVGAFALARWVVRWQKRNIDAGEVRYAEGPLPEPPWP